MGAEPTLRTEDLEDFDFVEVIHPIVRWSSFALVVRELGQATKGTRWMPWRQEPMKDVAGDEMLRGAASKL